MTYVASVGVVWFVLAFLFSIVVVLIDFGDWLGAAFYSFPYAPSYVKYLNLYPIANGFTWLSGTPQWFQLLVIIFAGLLLISTVFAVPVYFLIKPPKE